MKMMCKKILCAALTLAMLTASSVTAFADIPDPVYDEYGSVVLPSQRLVERVTDAADILTDDEEEKLLDTCDEISEEWETDVAVVTVDSLGERTSTEYADDYYDYNGLGQGDDRSGIVLLISMENRDWAISTCGKAIDYFTDAGQQYMIDEMKNYLSADEFYKAFDLYARMCGDYIEHAEEESPYDVNDLPKHSLRPFREELDDKLPTIILVSVAAAFLIWLIICLCEKKKLTSVSFKGQADDYIRKGSINITEVKDTFLSKHTTKRYNPPSQSSSGGGGSSVHSSSSGSSHGGSSGHF